MLFTSDLLKKNIIITGASSGLGRACAIDCSKAGAKVHIIGRNHFAIEKTMKMLEGEGHSKYLCDLSEFDKLPSMIEDIVMNFGKVSGFIHSAGHQIIKPIQTLSTRDYQRIFSINTISGFEICRLLSMKKNISNNGLSIVFISSIMSVVANAGLVAYCASKAALVGGAKAMAIELAPRGIRVNCISPGTVLDTAMTDRVISQLSETEFASIVNSYPLGLGSSHDVSSMCLYLLSDNAKWITGTNIIVDGGYTAK